MTAAPVGYERPYLYPKQRCSAHIWDPTETKGHAPRAAGSAYCRICATRFWPIARGARS